MSLKCDVTGSTDRVEKLPEYMQTETVKYVCFKVAVKMEKERLAGKDIAPKAEKPKETTVQKTAKVFNKPLKKKGKK